MISVYFALVFFGQRCIALRGDIPGDNKIPSSYLTR